MVATRDLFQYTACRRQTSPIAGTIFASTKLPLRTWFRAMYHLTQSKQGISSIELGRRLGVTQTTAWTVKHKLKQVMLERDAAKPLTGRVEIDDAYFSGERSGGKRGRGAPGKTPFVAAVETTPEGKPVRLKLGRVTSFCGASISGFAKRSLDPACTVVSDGLQCFGSVADAGCAHQAIKTGSGPAAAQVPAFKWGNTALGNIKAAITGTYRAISSKHVLLMGGVGMLGGSDLALPYPWIMRNCITIHGQWMYPLGAVTRLAALARSGVLDLSHYEVTEFDLGSVNEAVTYAAANGGPFRMNVVRP